MLTGSWLSEEHRGAAGASFERGCRSTPAATMPGVSTNYQARYMTGGERAVPHVVDVAHQEVAKGTRSESEDGRRPGR